VALAAGVALIAGRIRDRDTADDLVEGGAA
jgi:hypothetical protein